MKKIILSAVMAIALLGGTTMMMAQNPKPKSLQAEKTEVVNPKKVEHKAETSETKVKHSKHAKHVKKETSPTKSNAGKPIEATKEKK